MEPVILLGAGSCEALIWQVSFERNVLVESSVNLICDCSSSKGQHFVIYLMLSQKRISSYIFYQLVFIIWNTILKSQNWQKFHPQTWWKFMEKVWSQ